LQDKKVDKKKTFCKSLDKINENLDSMLSCKSKESGEVCAKNKKRLERINSLFKQIREIPSDGESLWNGTRQYIAKNADVMVKESKKKDGFYVTDSEARTVIKTVKKNVERLNKIIKNGNDKTSR